MHHASSLQHGGQSHNGHNHIYIATYSTFAGVARCVSVEQALWSVPQLAGTRKVPQDVGGGAQLALGSVATAPPINSPAVVPSDDTAVIDSRPSVLCVEH